MINVNESLEFKKILFVLIIFNNIILNAEVNNHMLIYT